MRHFSLLIGNETRGPLTEAEIMAMIAEGTLTADMLCAPEGSPDWVPLSDHFKFGVTLKLRRTKAVSTEVEEEIAATRLDPDTRRRLLLYGLAEPANVDTFTQVQAMLALADHEKKITSTQRLHRGVGYAALIAMVGGGALLGLSRGFGGDALAFCGSLFVKEELNARTSLAILRSELSQFAEIKTRAERAVFEKPLGGSPGFNVIASRLNIDPHSSFSLRGQVDTAPLTRKIAGWGLKLDDDRRVYVLREAPSAKAAELLGAQAAVLDEVLSPTLEEAGFAQLFAEVMNTFPAASFTEAGRLRKEAEGLRMSALKMFIDRVDFHAQAASSQSAQKAWSGQLLAFSERLKALQAKVYALTSPVARRKRWSEFNSGQGAELAAWMLTSGAKEVRVNPDGTFVISEISGINSDSLNLVIVSARIAGDTVFLPWNSKHLGTSKWTSEPMAKAFLIDRERYKVSDKVTVGGRTFYASLQTATHRFVTTRTSPQWRYLALARDTDKDRIFALVDDKTYAAASKGATITPAELAKFNLYLRAEESVRPDGLYVE
ncbi:MAG: hypothetical protein CAK86_04125 [Opitutia bacterium AMD-G1]|nr:MAG: hypothetical protein CAK86_04125 [Opitutae bacterium AMD-G1]